MRVMKRLVLLLLAAALIALLAACIPKPDHPLEYLQNADAVLVQRKVVELPASPVAQRLAVPDLTLYGDGTLIYAGSDGRLLQATVSQDTVRGLLEFITDTRFMDFNYTQPQLDRTTPRPTTYLYAQTKGAANAVSANALDSVLSDGGNEWNQFRKLQEIDARLDELAAGATPATDFQPEAMLLIVEPVQAPDGAGAPLDWPQPGIDLAAIAGTSTERVERRIDGAEGHALYKRYFGEGPHPALLGPFRESDRYFLTGYRPILPHESHFPEFES